MYVDTEQRIAQIHRRKKEIFNATATDIISTIPSNTTIGKYSAYE